MEDYNENYLDSKFHRVTIGEHSCNVNRDSSELDLLFHFSDIFPHYDENNGLHMKIKNKESENIVPIGENVISNLHLDKSKYKSQNEYLKAFVEKKTPMIDYLVRQTFKKGFESPSVVQSLGTLELVKGRDVLCQFKSGTGKTHTFLMGCLWSFDPSNPNLQYIFVTTSHEVADQTYKQAKFLLPEETKIFLCIGQKKEVSKTGYQTVQTSQMTDRAKQFREEKNNAANAQVIICTMGKFYDFFCNRKLISVKHLKAICIDEFDNIVASRSKPKVSATMSTEEQMAAIIKNIPPNAQRIFFSATVSNQSIDIAQKYFRPYDKVVGSPFIVMLDSEDYTLEGIRQYYVICADNEIKKSVLLDLLEQCRISQAIIFTNRIDTAKSIKNFLDNQKIVVTSALFHGDMDSIERKNIHQNFLENKIRLLISTNITARGLDIQGINLVINFDMPIDLQTYIHRIGRSGRHGRKGVAISLITDDPYDERNSDVDKIQLINECSKNNPMEELPENLADLL